MPEYIRPEVVVALNGFALALIGVLTGVAVLVGLKLQAAIAEVRAEQATKQDQAEIKEIVQIAANGHLDEHPHLQPKPKPPAPLPKTKRRKR